MAAVAIAFARSMEGETPVVSPVPTRKQLITSSVSSQQSTITAGNGEIAQITVYGGKVWVQFGDNPTAAAGSDYLILDGQTREFGLLSPGHKVAVIDG